MNEEELRKYFDIYTDCWKLFKKYSNPTDDDEFWMEFARESHDLNEKHGKAKFAETLILATYSEVERIWRENKKNER